MQILTSTDGTPIALHDFGGDGPPLLMSHGNGLNAGMWAACVPHLQQSFRCWGLDLRGHGGSRPESGYDVSRSCFAADVLTAVDEVGGPVFFAGHSLGAASVVHAALERADAFQALWLYEPVLISTDFVPATDGPSFLIEAARRRRMDFVSVDDALQRFLSKPPYSRCDPVAVRGYVEIGTYPTDDGVRLSCEGADEARVYESGEPLDFGRFAAIDVATVVAAGGAADEANALPPQLAPHVAEAMGDGRLERFESLSHFGPMEAPETVARSITAHFLGP